MVYSTRQLDLDIPLTAIGITDLDILVVDPAHQRRGLGSRLVEWGLARADELGVEAFLTASPFGKPLYEKQGFQVVASELILGDYVNTYMVRPAKAAGKG